MNSNYMISFLIVVLTIVVRSTNGCQCDGRLHPQEVYCRSNTVFVGFVESKKFGWKKPNGDFKSYDKDAYLNNLRNRLRYPFYQYKIRVTKRLKGNVTDRVLTVYSPLSCDVSLYEKSFYIIMGNMSNKTLELNSCNYKLELTHEKYQKAWQYFANLKKYWKKGCEDCEILSNLVYQYETPKNVCTVVNGHEHSFWSTYCNLDPKTGSCRLYHTVDLIGGKKYENYYDQDVQLGW